MVWRSGDRQLEGTFQKVNLNVFREIANGYLCENLGATITSGNFLRPGVLCFDVHAKFSGNFALCVTNK